MMKSLVPFPLYHGTSSLFFQSIIEVGLGARNPLVTARGVECLRTLIALADEALAGDASWAGDRYSLCFMAEQTVTGANMNFRHGGTYLSPSEITAVRYAVSNALGSELLSECVKLFNRISAVDGSRLHSFSSDFPQVYQLAKSAARPILFKVSDVPLEAVRTEVGGSALAQIEDLASVDDEAVREAWMQQSNFELVSPVDHRYLQAWLIQCSVSFPISTEDYRLEPYGDAT